MILISASDITKRFGKEILFEKVSFSVNNRDRIGLIGPNGCGKTTLFRILLGKELHVGNLQLRKNLRIACLDQKPTFPDGATVHQVMLDAMSHVFAIEEEIDGIHQALGKQPDPAVTAQLLKRLAVLEREHEVTDGHDTERRIQTVLHGLGFEPSRYEHPVEQLSGGEVNRLALARLLLDQPDLWLLDEPTNHLDLDGIQFLESFLKTSSTAAIIVSHDRHFMDEVTRNTWELEGGGLHCYPGSYSKSRDIRQSRHDAQWNAYVRQQDTIRKEESYIERYRSGQRAREARGRSKRLARLERVERPAVRERIAALDLDLGARLGNRILEVSKLEKYYDERKLFGGISFELEAGETLAVVGANGAGKTTFLNILLGTEAASAGEYRWGQTVDYGVLHQQESFPSPEITPLEYACQCAEGRKVQQLRDMLAAMLFRGDDVHKPVAALSGGEKKRLILLRLLLENNNVLLLDEPTNHLDVESREALELALSVYPGSMVVISHDRYFIDQIADRVLWLEEDGHHITRGGFKEAEREHLRRLGSREAKKDRATAPVKRDKAVGAPQTQSKTRFHRMGTDKIESRIIECEELIDSLNQQLNEPEVYSDSEKLSKIAEQLESTKIDLDELEAEYLRRG